MGVVVQKFGGTSVANPDLRDRAIAHIRNARSAGHSVVVVVSAMGRRGQPYATDTLLGLVGVCASPEASPRDLDLLMCCGEIVSTVVMADALCRAGIPAIAFTGAQAGVLTDSNHGDAHILEVRPERLLEQIAGGMVPVVAGFQGVTLEGDFTTLGRGGSDTTASALGVALAAEVVEIFTDVEGVMTADPRVVKDAKVLDTITYREVAEMAHLGAKVIHPRAVEIAMEGRIPMRVRCTMSEGPGTLIADCVGPVDSVTIKGDRVVTGIASISAMALVALSVSQNEGKDPLRVFRVLAQQAVSVDLISVSPGVISFIIREGDTPATERAMAEIGLLGTVEAGFAKVSIVGAGMRGVPGVMASVVEALDKAGIAIFQTTDSHTTISCLVRQESMVDAITALHGKFGLA